MQSRSVFLNSFSLVLLEFHFKVSRSHCLLILWQVFSHRNVSQRITWQEIVVKIQWKKEPDFVSQAIMNVGEETTRKSLWGVTDKIVWEKRESQVKRKCQDGHGHGIKKLVMDMNNRLNQEPEKVIVFQFGKTKNETKKSSATNVSRMTDFLNLLMLLISVPQSLYRVLFTRAWVTLNIVRKCNTLSKKLKHKLIDQYTEMRHSWIRIKSKLSVFDQSMMINAMITMMMRILRKQGRGTHLSFAKLVCPSVDCFEDVSEDKKCWWENDWTWLINVIPDIEGHLSSFVPFSCFVRKHLSFWVHECLAVSSLPSRVRRNRFFSLSISDVLDSKLLLMSFYWCLKSLSCPQAFLNTNQEWTLCDSDKQNVDK